MGIGSNMMPDHIPYPQVARAGPSHVNCLMYILGLPTFQLPSLASEKSRIMPFNDWGTHTEGGEEGCKLE